VGLLIDSYEIYAWMYESINRLTNLDFVEISLVIFCEQSPTKKSKLSQFWENKSVFLYNIFDKMDQFFFRNILYRGNPNAFEKKSIKKILSGLPIIKVKPRRKKYSDYFECNDVEKIRNYKTDIIIRLSRERILRGDILSCSKYGIWSDHHADNYVNRGTPPGFWEVFEDIPETGSILQILNEDLDGGLVLYRSWSSTYPFSPAWNRNLFYWASSSFLPRQVRLLYNLGEKEYFRRIIILNKEINFYSHRLFLSPNNYQMVKIFFMYFKKIISKIYQDIFFHQYSYLLYKRDSGLDTSIRKFKKISLPGKTFFSNPHLVIVAEKSYVFCNEYVKKRKRHIISVIQMENDNFLKKPIRISDNNLSIKSPYVFEYQEKYFMIPESTGSNTIDLYECINFPYDWKLKMNLIKDVRAVSPSIIFFNTKWWLFIGMSENKISSPNDELFLFYSDDLFTNRWKSHPLNPVISDIKSARPAGKIFLHNNSIYRPSRNGSKWGEYSINVNKIIRMSETDYKEEKIDAITPNWNNRVRSTHTLCYNKSITVIDAFEQKRRFL
jgi:hypothetical protein